MTHEKSNFMEENEAQEGCKWDIGFVVGLFGYTFYFPLPFGFIFIGFYKYSFAYVYSLCTRLNIKQIRKFCLNKKNNSINFFNKNNSLENIILNKRKFFLLIKIQKNVFRKIQKKNCF